jgi:hypothetical protein
MINCRRIPPLSAQSEVRRRLARICAGLNQEWLLTSTAERLQIGAQGVILDGPRSDFRMDAYKTCSQARPSATPVECALAILLRLKFSGINTYTKSRARGWAGSLAAKLNRRRGKAPRMIFLRDTLSQLPWNDTLDEKVGGGSPGRMFTAIRDCHPALPIAGSA